MAEPISSPWFELFDPSEREGYGALLAVLDAMSRDYHNSRGLPDIPLEGHLAALQFSPELCSFVREHLRLISITGAELIDRGLGRDLLLTLGVVDVRGGELRTLSLPFTAAIAWPKGELVCFIPQMLFVDLSTPARFFWA